MCICIFIVPGLGFGHWLVPIAQPSLHEHDLVLLGVDDPLRQREQRRARTMRRAPIFAMRMA